jgi:ABC-type bacteriocin/lantibiotic exporter with double-glycine peptidase domain
MATDLQLLRVYLDRIDDVNSAAPEQTASRLRPAHSLSGRIVLEDVSFRYGPLEPLVLDHISVELEAGQLVAIVGPSGSGKSTLASLLLGLHPPTSGRVVYDGASLAEVDLRGVRRQLGIVTQRAHIFNASVRANIALAYPDMNLEAVVHAAQLAQIHDEIVRMPMGYDTALGDGGGSISGGQRQRIALARALVSTPAILLLDEATSALDAVTEARVQAALESLKCTRVVIAHRLSTVRSADRILVVDGGKLVEQGTHEELMRAGTLYARLAQAQMAG